MPDAVAFPVLPEPDQSAWTLNRELTRDGSTRVFVAQRDDDLRVQALIKVLDPRLADDARARDQFRGDVAALLDAGACDAVPGHLGHGEAQLDGVEVPYVITTHEPGVTLRELMAGKPMGMRHALVYSEQIAGALACMHGNAQQVIHLSLTPERVWVPDDHALPVRLLDFALQASNPQVLSVPAGNYLCPEQVNQGDPTPLWDVYSAGLMLHEMLTGALPSTTELTDGRQRLDVETSMPDDLRTIIECAIAPVDERCTAEEMHEALAYVFDRMTTQESPEVSPTVTETTQPTSRLAQRSLAAQQFLENKSVAPTLIARAHDFSPRVEEASAVAPTPVAKTPVASAPVAQQQRPKWQPMQVPTSQSKADERRARRQAEAQKREAAKAERRAKQAEEGRLAAIKKAEADAAAKVAAEKRALEAKEAAEKRAEEQKLANEKRAEEQKLAAEKRAEEQKLANEKRAAEAQEQAEKRAAAKAAVEEAKRVAAEKKIADKKAADEAKRIAAEQKQTSSQQPVAAVVPVPTQQQAVSATADDIAPVVSGAPRPIPANAPAQQQEEGSLVTLFKDAPETPEGADLAPKEASDEVATQTDSKEVLPLWLVIIFCVIVLAALAVTYLGYTGALHDILNSFAKVFK